MLDYACTHTRKHTYMHTHANIYIYIYIIYICISSLLSVQAKLKAYEEELAMLNSMSATAAKAGDRHLSGLDGRKAFLLGQISLLSDKVSVLEKQRAECEAALKE